MTAHNDQNSDINNQQLAQKITLGELAQQLSCPSGDFGKMLGGNMHQSNLTMTQSAIELLDIQDNDSILELGHGNAGHLNELFEQAHNIHYYGLEVSALMTQQASELNELLAKKHNIEFGLYDGLSLASASKDFQESQFDKIFSVNTLYFWQNPKQLINELAYYLKANGILILVYAQKEFMQTLPFVEDNFTLYDDATINDLIHNTSLNIIEFMHKRDKAVSKTGDMVDRKYTVVMMVKES